jgi:hypothetical protein
VGHAPPVEAGEAGGRPPWRSATIPGHPSDPRGQVGRCGCSDPAGRSAGR